MPRPLTLSFSQLVDRSWEQYCASFVSYLSITSWLLVPGLLLIVALLLYPTADNLILGADLTRLQGTGVLLYVLTKSMILPLVALWTYIAVVRLAFSQLAGRRGEPRKALEEGQKLLLPVLGATVLFGLCLAAGYVGPLLPGSVLSIATTGRYDMSWLVLLRNLLVVAGVFGSAYFSVRFFGQFQFAALAVTVGDAKPLQSLKESASLVRGRFWAVLFRSLLAKLLFLFLGAAALWVATTLLDIAVSIAATTAFFPALRVETLVFSLLSWVGVPIFITPLLSLVDVHLYRDMRETL